jgi:hypothetical protein
MSLRAQFLEFDDALASRGVPPLTAWWRDGIGAWLDAYEGQHVLELWGCVGRGAAKSTALYKLSAFFAVFGDFVVPAGERHYAIVLSRLREEAGKGIAIIARWLALLGVPHHVAGDVVELDELPRGVRVVAASVAAASGWRAFFVGKDERSKWPSSGIEEIDATEIDTSATSMTATHALAPSVSFGSAWGAFGSFFDAIDGGTTAERVVLGPTPTWIAAPHITEESTHRKERDPKRWAREYKCVFQSGATSALDPDHVRACLRPFRQGERMGQVIMACDWSQGRGDGRARLFAQFWTPEPTERDLYETEDLADGCYRVVENPNGTWKRKPTPPVLKPELHVFGIAALEGRWADQGITSDAIIADDVAAARPFAVSQVFADPYMGLVLQSDYARHQLAYVPQTWSTETKSEALMQLRRWLADGQLVIEETWEGRRLVEEMVRLSEIIRPSGALSIGARSGHDDRVACLLNVAMAQAALHLPGSPHGSGDGMTVHKADGRVIHYGG